MIDDRFKFRAWDGKEFHFFDFSEDPCSWGLHGDWEVQQCTGIKDKHGNFIYEKDIVESTKIWDDGSEMVRINHIKDIRNIPRDLFFGSYSGHNEIIGNVLENPELMEVKE